MNRKRTKKSNIFTNNPARSLFYLNAFLWFAYMVYIYYDMAVVNHNGWSAVIAALFILGNALLLAASGFLLGRPKKWAYYFAFVAALLNAALIVASHSDIFLMVMFVIDLFILGILISFRKIYYSRS
jgi:hypothetical protein